MVMFKSFSSCVEKFDSRKRRRVSHISKAVTPGVVPDAATIKEILETSPISEATNKWLSKMDNFSTKLEDVSNKTSTNYTANVEKNSKAIFEFAKTQYQKLRPGIGSEAMNAMFNATSIGGTTNAHTNALPRLASLLAKGNTYGFWDAVMIKVQGERDMEQQVDTKVGMKIDEYNKARDSLRIIGAGYSLSSKKTQSLDYINGTSKAQKLEDEKAFQQWVSDNESPYAAIIRLNLSDIPFSFAAVELIAFEKDQKDPAKKTAVKNKLNELKKEALEWVRAQYKATPNVNPKVREWLNTK